jgi:hypothetical protein
MSYGFGAKVVKLVDELFAQAASSGEDSGLGDTPQTPALELRIRPLIKVYIGSCWIAEVDGGPKPVR